MQSDARKNYPRNRDVAFIAALVLVIISIRLSAEFVAFVPELDMSEIPPVMVEQVPPTEQGKKKKPPPRPAVPIPSDDDEIPEEETIEPIEFDLFADNGEEGGSSEGEHTAAPTLIPPRPIAWVIPEYPEKERKRGVKGEVKLSIEIDVAGKVVDAVVLENSTGSDLCAKAAVRAAMASRFIPARKNGEPANHWLIMPYRFDLEK